MTVQLEDDRRTATLATGEVLFDVHHEAARPFTVMAAGRDVRVLGTEFDVLDEGGNFAVAVRRGWYPSRPQSTAASSRSCQPERRSAERGARVDTVERIDPDQALAWEHGQLVFTDKPIESIAHTLSRYMGAPISVDPALRGMKISAIFQVADRSQFRRQIEAALLFV
ncbi:fec operon regulator FecR [Sphingomonas paucimobilis]|nr:fec operon regulator FecR [Sphingomonas paucimobilis]